MSKPVFSIHTSSGKDLTGEYASRFISLSIVDERGMKSDRATLKLTDAANDFVPPSKGDVWRIAMGYGKHLVHKGEFAVDNPRFSGPPDVWTITAKAVDMGGTLKSKRIQSWHQNSLGEILSTIAARNRLTLAISEEFAAIQPGHIDQTNESDMNFITRLAKDYGAIATVKDKHLIFSAEGESKTVTGKALPIIEVHKTSAFTWDLDNGERSQHGKVRAYYHSTNQAKRLHIDVGDKEPKQTLPHTYDSKTLATTAAYTKFKQLNRGKAKLELTIEGHPEIIAEAKINCSGFHADINRQWLVASCTHSITSSGYTTTIKAESN